MRLYMRISRDGANPYAPFPLEVLTASSPAPNVISDGKWVTLYKGREEVWVCNARYAAAHFDFVPVPTHHSSMVDHMRGRTRLRTSIQRRRLRRELTGLHPEQSKSRKGAK